METDTSLNNTSKTKSFFIQHYCILIILFVAAFLRFYKLDFQSLWMDEIYTLNITNPKLSFSQLFDAVKATEGFPYLYYIILRFFYIIFGYSPLVARLVSVLAGIGGVYMIYVFTKNIFNKNTALIVAALLAVNDFHIFYSQEARSYSLYFLCTIFAFYKVSKFIQEPTLKNGLWYGAAAALLLNISFFGAINLVSQAVLILLFIIYSKPEQRLNILKFSAIAGVIAIISFLPNYKILETLLSYPSFWVPKPQPDSFTLMFKEFLGNSEILMFIFGLVYVFYFITVSRHKTDVITADTIKKEPVTYSFIMFFLWFTSVITVLFIKSSVSITSLILGRYFISIVPVFMVVAGIGIYLIKNRIVKTTVITALLFFSLVNLVVVKRYYTGVHKSQYREVAAFIQKNNTKGSKVYTSLKYMYDFYLNNNNVKTNLLESPLEDHVKAMMANPANLEPFWYADAHIRPYNVSPEAAAFLNKYFYVENNFDGYDAWTRFYQLKTNLPALNFSKFGVLKPANGDAFNYNIESFDVTGTVLKTAGWAYFSNQEANASSVHVVLINGDKIVELPLVKVLRADVTTYFKLNYNVENSGFSCEYDFSELEPGVYKAGIYLNDKATKKEGLIISDKTITK